MNHPGRYKVDIGAESNWIVGSQLKMFQRVRILASALEKIIVIFWQRM